MTHHLPQSRDRADGAASVRRRRCFVSRETRERHDLLRFVYDGDQRLCWDAAEKLPGRGWWLALEKDPLLGGTRKLIARQAPKKGQEQAGQEQAGRQQAERQQAGQEQAGGQQAERQQEKRGEATAEEFLRSCALVLEQRCLSYIALARRAGLAVAGARCCLDMANGGGLKALITTPQSSLEERRKILKADRRSDAPVCCARFSATALGRVFAREDAVYVGVGGKKARASVGLVERLLHEIDRFERLLRILECESTEDCEPFPPPPSNGFSSTQKA